jgi:esterase/lipase
VYFLSDSSGLISLYRMRIEGSIPEPLLPAGIALQNPHLMIGDSFVVFPQLERILVMIDSNGDENYQPSFVPLEGGTPEPIFGSKFAKQQLACIHFDRDTNVVYFYRDNRKTPDIECLKTDLKSLEQTSLGTSIYGNFCAGTSRDHSKVILVDGYTAGDNVLYLWTRKSKKRELLFGVPIEKRDRKLKYAPSGIFHCNFTDDDRGVYFRTTLFNDEGSLGYLNFNDPTEISPVSVRGIRHRGQGELDDVRKINGKCLLQYNIDGCNWIYEGRFTNAPKPSFTIDNTIVGKPPVSNGVVLGIEPWAFSSRQKRAVGYAYSFTKAVTPSQLYIFNPTPRAKRTVVLSSERVLGIDRKFLSEGEDASYRSFDGLRISARLYLPSESLGLKPPFPLVHYVHGGPQGQERPDFTWFSMPLIQYLALNGFAVFVPNVRGSTGYGSNFMKMVDHDWGGKDAQDHVEGLRILEKDSRIDSCRRGVIGRSYGGYMTLTLVSRFPHLWKAGVDMFGPYNLLTFLERLPETWQTSFKLSLGDPVKDHDFLLERSPFTYIDQVKCPMLMIQGRNDPRVVERETADVVERLRTRGLPVDYLMFEDEGHDVIKLKNRVTCYNRITAFFTQHLKG